MPRLTIDRQLLLLVSLAAGPKHGYALMKDIQTSSGIRIGAGTLYGCLASLEENGLIVALPIENRRQPYELTKLGQKELKEHLIEAAKLSKLGLARLTTS